MSSEITVVPAKIKQISPLALCTHCFTQGPRNRNLIGIINKSYLVLKNSLRDNVFF